VTWAGAVTDVKYNATPAAIRADYENIAATQGRAFTEDEMEILVRGTRMEYQIYTKKTYPR
jgi:hypothetical protein